MLNLPTGSGKTLIGLTHGQLFDGPKLYATSTRGLQSAVHHDAAELGIADVRGMGNHDCVEHGGKCDDAPCLDGQFCALRDGGCLYYDSVRRGALSQWVVTNYAWWLGSRDKTPGLGPRPYLVLDEAHAAHEHLASHVRTELDPSTLPPFLRPSRGWERWDMTSWVGWAKYRMDDVRNAKAESMTRSMRHKFRILGTTMQRIADATGVWFIQVSKEGVVTFEPLWPHEYAGPLLFRDAARVILMSATIRPRELRYLGLKIEDVDFVETASPIASWRRPFFHVPVAKLSSKTPREIWRTLVERMDAVIADRLHWRGIIHVPSYELGEMILARSAYRHLMIAPRHTSQTVPAVESFRASTPGKAASIIVSPSLGTGWDFPFDQARYQLIAKLNAPVPTALMQAREADDPGYGWYRTAQDVQQRYGRIARDPDDYGETFCFDDHIVWMRRAHRDWFTSGFHDAFRRLPVGVFPKPYPV